VPQEEAIRILSRKSRHAAWWWKENGFPQPDQCFGFKMVHAEIVGTLKEIRPRICQFVGLLEVGVGAHDANESPYPDCGHAAD
jgi:hypothetical protein